jgi:hypothetical protein
MCIRVVVPFMYRRAILCTYQMLLISTILIFSPPPPPKMALVMDLPPSKPLRVPHHVNNRYINSYFV